MIREDIIISGDLTLGSLRKKDLSQLVYLLNDEKVYTNTLTIPYPYKMKDARHFYDLIQQWEETFGIKREWQIRLNDEMIGGIGLVYENGITSHKSKLGYWIGAPYRGKGIMAYVLKGFIHYIFQNRPGLLRLEAHVFPNNISSQKTLEKNGFIREGYFKHYYRKDDEIKDAIQYAVFNPTIS